MRHLQLTSWLSGRLYSRTPGLSGELEHVLILSIDSGGATMGEGIVLREDNRSDSSSPLLTGLCYQLPACRFRWRGLALPYDSRRFQVRDA